MECRPPPQAQTSLEKTVAVRRGGGHKFVADGGARARAILHDDAVAELIRQILRHHTREYIDGRARGIGRDDAYRLGRIGLRGGLVFPRLLLPDSIRGNPHAEHETKQSGKNRFVKCTHRFVPSLSGDLYFGRAKVYAGTGAAV